jgi:hypothetical protein
MNCVKCERTSDQVPLIKIDYKGSQYAICPEHLPNLIHKPATLANKLPNAGEWVTGDANHGH